MKALLIGIFLGWVGIGFGGPIQHMHAVVAKKRSGAAASYIVNQNFEGAGYDNGETWSETGTLDEDYTTSPAPLAGSQSFRMLGVESDYRNVLHDFTDQTEAWGYMLINFQKIENSLTFGGFYNGAYSQSRAWLSFTGGALTVTSGGQSATTVTTLSTSTTYHVWWYYKQGSGANAEAWVAFSTDGTRPTSGNQYAGFTNGDATGTADAMAFVGSSGGAADLEFIVDRVLVDDVVIGNSP